MGKKVERINMGRIIAAPVLNGANDEYVWTGILKSDKIDNHIIPDDKQRDVFIKKVRMVEQGVLKYRRFSRASNSVLQIKQEESFEYLKHDILELCKEIKSILNDPDSIGMDINLYWIAFCRDYEEIKQKNDIIEVISEYVELRKMGESYFGICPFHEDKTETFSVNPDWRI